MSKLEELINELCPDGVELRKFGELVDYEQPTKYIVRDTNYNDKYEIPVLTAGQSFILGYTDEVDNHYCASKENPVIIFDDFTGAFKWVDFEFKVKSSAMKMLTVNNSTTTLRYVYYCMEHLNFSSTEHKRLWIGTYSEFTFPVPPIEVQEEIVRILDSFTSLIDDLNTELTLRKKQYEEYKEKLISNNNCFPRVPLKEIATEFYKGSGIKKDEVTETGASCVRYGEIYTQYNAWFEECISHTNLDYIKTPKYFEYGDILFAITGESVEDIAKSTAYIGSEKCVAGGDIVVMKHNQNPKYISYALSTFDARKQKSKGKVKSKVVHSNVPSIKQIEIPLPTLEEQKRIADSLDKFEILINDKYNGIQAEIELRQKQYEYYRDKLLTFSEKV